MARVHHRSSGSGVVVVAESVSRRLLRLLLLWWWWSSSSRIHLPPALRWCRSHDPRVLFASAASSSPPPEETDPMDFVPTARLSNGIEIPLVGLGCASGVRTRHVSSALRLGYRFLDTAQSYSWGYHEDEVGVALRAFLDEQNPTPPPLVQTKIHPEDLGYNATKRAVEESFRRLGVGVIDSVLIHKPRCWEGACRRQPEGTWQDSWKALEELYRDGRIRAIGICDVTEALLDELLRQEIPPHIVQNWMDPLHQDQAVRRRCSEHGIQYQAYSSLGTQWVHHRGYEKNPVLEHPTLLQLARAHGVGVAQIVVRWATGHGISVLPASTNPQRQRANLLDSFRFRLSPDEVAAIDALDGRVPARPRTDPDKVSIRFENRSGAGPVDVYWIGGDRSEVPIQTNLAPGDSLKLDTYHGHEFVFKDSESGKHLGQNTISRHNGKTQEHMIGGGSEL